MLKKICQTFLIIFFSGSVTSVVVFGQNESYTNPAIKSVYFEKKEWKLAYPGISLSSDEEIMIHFDMLSDNAESLCYTFIHCDRKWNNSDLFYNDYIDGFEENTFNSYGSSFNTRITYSHYQITFPNDDVKFKLSGNYLLVIYRYGEEETPLLTRRIMVHEGAAPMKIVYRRPVGKEYNTGQQPEISISLSDPGVTDPYRQISLTILQNGRWDKSKRGIKPDFIGDGTIEYNTLGSSTLFEGSNEFRFFDIKSIRQTLQNVRAIDYLNGNYHAFLLPSENRENKQHFANEDLNGKYYVAMDGSDEADLDADYVYVYFTLPVFREIPGGSLYVTGALTDWEYTPDNKMTYNPGKGCYEATLLLKQGWYNYEYAFIADGKTDPEGDEFEGSHYETENDYLMLVYFHDPRERYDRLLNCYFSNTSGNQ